MADVNVDPTEQLLARADRYSRFYSDGKSKTIAELAAALRATRTELETARATRQHELADATETGRLLGQEDMSERLWAAEATLQQAQQLARKARDSHPLAWNPTGPLITFLLKDEP